MSVKEALFSWLKNPFFIKMFFVNIDIYSLHLQVYALWGWRNYLQEWCDRNKDFEKNHPLDTMISVPLMLLKILPQSMSLVGTNWNQWILHYFCLH